MSDTIELYDELSQNFIEYAAAVNSDRSIPDATSGLKPVARRILWSMFDEGQLSSKPHVKSAHVVGNVLAKLHPHGDSSVYGALIRLSQDWVMRYPLVDIHGNNGNIAGDGPASMRYTEARLSKIAEDGIFTGIQKQNVPFMLTYDDAAVEPMTLPSIFPNLLCNPNSGIGVAIASSWAPHNLREVAQAIFDYLDGKEPILLGPDFPTGGVIINKNDIPQIMRTGHGSVIIRGRYKVEKNQIIFYEIPYGVTIESLLDEIGTACDKQELHGIADIRDESTKRGIRLVIECDSISIVDQVVKQLFQKTDLQTSFSYNQIGLVDRTPTELNLEDCINIYVNCNINSIKMEAEFDLRKAEARKEVVEGLLKALEDIDNIITLIKHSENAVAAKDNLIKTYNFTEPQAKAIVDMKLGKLASLEKIELEEENQELEAKLKILDALIVDSYERIKLLRVRLEELVKKYGDDRRTGLMQIEQEKAEKEEIIAEDAVFTLTKDGKAQTVKKNSPQKENEIVKIKTDTADYLYCFSSFGKMYKLFLNKFPNFQGLVNINTILPMQPNEKILAVFSEKTLVNSSSYFIVFFTKNGLIKKTCISEYLTLKRNNGIIAIKIKENDSLINVCLVRDETLMVVTNQNNSFTISNESILSTGRVTFGSKMIKLKEDESVVAGGTHIFTPTSVTLSIDNKKVDTWNLQE